MTITLPQSQLVAFIDESGDFEMNKIDPRNPVCAQCAITSTVEAYSGTTVSNMVRMKYHFFGTECVILHGHKIRKKSGDFSFLQDENVRLLFMESLVYCFSQMAGALIIAAVDKPKHKAKYVHPEDPFFLSLQFLLERLHDHWRAHLQGGVRLLCIFEKRGPADDRRTREMFDRICGGENYRNRQFPFDADFRLKSENIVGHQYADLAAYTACRYVESRDEERKDWKAVRGKLRTTQGGFLGHGLKIFPA